MGHVSYTETDRVVFKTYYGSSQDLATTVKPSNGSGAWLAGYYHAPKESIILDQTSPSGTFGSPLVMYGGHFFVVCGGTPVTDGGPVILTVTGTALLEPGLRYESYSESIELHDHDVDCMVQTEARWLGEVTMTLSSAGATAFSAEFNYGYALFETFGGRPYKLDSVEIMGSAGDNDDEFDVVFFQHKEHDGWVFNATDFEPGVLLASMKYVVGAESNLGKNQPFGGYKKEIEQYYRGDQREGVVIKMITGSDKSVPNLTLHLGAVV